VCYNGVYWKRSRVKLYGLHPFCWIEEAIGYYMKGIGNLLEVMEKKQLGNGMIQCTLIFYWRLNVSVPDF